jgi:hypothetical protein
MTPFYYYPIVMVYHSTIIGWREASNQECCRIYALLQTQMSVEKLFVWI